MIYQRLLQEMLTKSARAVTAPPTDATAGTGLAAFATALHQLDMVAVCRFVGTGVVG